MNNLKNLVKLNNEGCDKIYIDVNEYIHKQDEALIKEKELDIQDFDVYITRYRMYNKGFDKVKFICNMFDKNEYKDLKVVFISIVFNSTYLHFCILPIADNCFMYYGATGNNYQVDVLNSCQEVFEVLKNKVK